MVRQKVKGKGNPWWVFVAHNNKRISRMIGDKRPRRMCQQDSGKARLGEFDIEEEKKDRERNTSLLSGSMLNHGSQQQHQLAARNRACVATKNC